MELEGTHLGNISGIFLVNEKLKSLIIIASPSADTNSMSNLKKFIGCLNLCCFVKKLGVAHTTLHSYGLCTSWAALSWEVTVYQVRG